MTTKTEKERYARAVATAAKLLSFAKPAWEGAPLLFIDKWCQEAMADRDGVPLLMTIMRNVGSRFLIEEKGSAWIDRHDGQEVGIAYYLVERTYMLRHLATDRASQQLQDKTFLELVRAAEVTPDSWLVLRDYAVAIAEITFAIGLQRFLAEEGRRNPIV